MVKHEGDNAYASKSAATSTNIEKREEERNCWTIVSLN